MRNIDKAVNDLLEDESDDEIESIEIAKLMGDKFDEVGNKVRDAIDELRELVWYAPEGRKFREEHPEEFKVLNKIMTDLHYADNSLAKML
jgi:hypothetical protein